MLSAATELLDLDHVTMKSGFVYRVVGNLDDPDHFLGYNVYSPSEDGDRVYQGVRYRKNFIEDDELPVDVLDTYQLLSTAEVVEHHGPIQSAISQCGTFKDTVWFELYSELVNIFGQEWVGIFGSSMFGLHSTPSGGVRKDIDFVIQGLENVPVLRQNLPKIREKLGFTTVTKERQLKQYARYQKVFRNERNSIRSIIARRWTGLQLSESVVSTIRLRDPTLKTPIELVTQSPDDLDNVVISGKVVESDSSNLFPRRFTVRTDQGRHEIYSFWWKFSTPVRDGDQVTLCGSLITVGGRPVVRLTSFTQHWLRIYD